MFYCKRCGYTTNKKGNLKNHYLRKRPCKPILSNIRFDTLIEEFNKKSHTNTHKSHTNTHKSHTNTHKSHTNTHKCNHCDKVFVRADSLKRHLDKYCKEKIKIDKQKSLLEYMSQQIIEIKTEKEKLEKEKEKERLQHDKERQQHEKEKAELRLQIEKLLEKVGNNNTTNTNNIQTQIVLNNFGKENVEYINSNYINKLIQQGIYAAVPKIIKYLHFNPEHPENRNVKITNKKETWAQIWNNDKWELKNKKLVISDIVDKGYNIIDDNKKPEDLNRIKKSKLNNFQEKYDSNDKETHKYLNKEVETLILNESK